MSGKPGILIVDDEAFTRSLVKKTLDKQDYEVFSASSGEDALVLIEGNRSIDVVLLDIIMPGLDGFRVLEILKGNPQTENIKVIMLTAMAQVEDKVKAFSSGASDYIVKPFEREELIARVKSQVAIRGTEQELRKHRDNLDEMVKERTAELVIANEKLRREANERKWAELILRESEEKYRDLVERANDGIVIIQDMLLKYSNPRLLEMTGYTLDEGLDAQFTDYVYPDELSKVADLYQRRMAGEEIPSIYETALRCKDGNRLDVEFNTGFIMYKGRPADLVIVRDISERMRAEEELGKERDFSQNLLNIAAALIVGFNHRGEITLFNKYCEEATGWKSEEVFGKNWLDVFVPERHKTEISDDFRVIVKEDETFYQREQTILTRDGRERIISWNSTNVKDSEGNVETMLSIGVDVTERKIAQQRLMDANTQLQATIQQLKASHEQLVQSGKLAALGELLAGVAHEINNPLMAISGYTELLLEDAEDVFFRQALQNIRDETRRVIKIVRNLLSFARRYEPEKAYISINDSLLNTVEMRLYEMSLDNIEVTTELAADLPCTMADSNQLQQVFLNLISNAEQSMRDAHGEGKLIVRTEDAGEMIKIEVH